MTKPDDIPQDVWTAARGCFAPKEMVPTDAPMSLARIARAIMAEREACAEACLGRPFGKIFAAAIRNRGATTPGSMQAEADPGGLVERNGRQ